MEVREESSRLIKPLYESEPPSLTESVPLSAFDMVTYNASEAVIFAFESMEAVGNHVVVEALEKVLAEFRVWAGRFGRDSEGRRAILLNDAGVHLVEVTVGFTLHQAFPTAPTPALLHLHPSADGTEELLQVQLTRFSCGGLAVGLTCHHFVADGTSAMAFFTSWSRVARGLPLLQHPLHDRTIFMPRESPRCPFEHLGVEYMRLRSTSHKTNSVDIRPLPPPRDSIVQGLVVHRTHFSCEFLAMLKAKASICNPDKPYSTFTCLIAHVWRVVTKARGIEGPVTTSVRISVDGRARLKPAVPREYFGNVILWAFPQAQAGELLKEPLHFAAKLVYDAVKSLDNEYFRSFIDFTKMNEGGEGLVPSAEMEQLVLCPNLEVDCWLNLPFYEFDFGRGPPSIFMPSWLPYEGFILVLPSRGRDGGVDVLVPLLENNMTIFKEICFSMD
ncbi:agmatine hydroxycinnamoyltransferase 1 [Amborella trichopoda]|uniref:Uncharacterized protein n=1 Tax=Amborella trichopoda TaxID=13333 RepID=W1P079_AMBTC|nr:agmatine hydroxycinnamoyltransferase 1 [Amborella trichopoda]ERN01338.1 hypothetical protein AMTR_s00002p00257440 [Amborella trichopoda]|eukprot:XP_006838769.1 agmatine hydroxycinnamoyltransferase 1 [Amborella trichopoda]